MKVGFSFCFVLATLATIARIPAGHAFQGSPGVPVITSVTTVGGSPLTQAWPGLQVQIHGSGFGLNQGSSFISFNNFFVQLVMPWSDGVVTLTIPPYTIVPSGTYQLQVDIWDGNSQHSAIKSNAVSFVLIPAPPQISSLSAGATGIPGGYRTTQGAKITIYGSGFTAFQGEGCDNPPTGIVILSLASTGQEQVSQNYQYLQSDEIAFGVPSTIEPGAYNLYLADALNHKSNPVSLLIQGVAGAGPGSVLNGPEITLISPNPAVLIPGATATIYGAGMGARQGTGSVSIKRTGRFNRPISISQGLSWSPNMVIFPIASSLSPGSYQVAVIPDSSQACGAVSNAVTLVIGTVPQQLSATLGGQPIAFAEPGNSIALAAAFPPPSSIFGMGQGSVVWCQPMAVVDLEEPCTNGIDSVIKGWMANSVSVQVPPTLNDGEYNVWVIDSQQFLDGYLFGFPVTTVLQRSGTTKILPSEMLCGNITKPTLESLGLAGNPQVKGMLLKPPYKDACESASGVVDSNGRPIRATERVEVRGWLPEAPAGGCDPAEVCWNTILDYGWKSESLGASLSLNTPELIVQHLTPHDIMNFGAGDETPSTFSNAALNDLQSNCLDTSTFGIPEHDCVGEMADGIHVEADGWRTPGFNPTGNHSGDFQIPAPPDWNQMDTQQSGTVPENNDMNGNPTTAGELLSRWPFDPFDPPAMPGQSAFLAQGDYVRIVGTLWEDHPSGGWATRCWDSSVQIGTGTRNNRGWKEIHPVDYIARLGGSSSGRDLTNDKLVIVTICGAGNGITKTISLGTPPPNSALACTEILNTEWTVSPQTDIGTDQITPLADGTGVQVQLKLNPRGPLQGDPKFYAGYHVRWQPQSASSGTAGFQCPRENVP